MPTGAVLVNGTAGDPATRLVLCKLSCRDTTLEETRNFTDGELRACEAGCDVSTLESYGGSADNCTAACNTALLADYVTDADACAVGCTLHITSGSYIQDGISASDKSDCLACPGGHKCAAATVDPVPCGLGKVSDVGSATCSACHAGYICTAEATSLSAMLSTMACPPGLFCRTGLQNVSDAVPCPKGHYCPEGTPEPVDCPVGTFNNATQQSSISACLPCTAGAYCLEESIVPNGPCAAGYFCPDNITTGEFINGVAELIVGSFGPRQEPCAGGSYRNLTGGRFQSDCDTCPAGYYCPPGSSKPTTCPRGYYCQDGFAAPTPCPKGTVGSSPRAISQDNCTACSPGFFCDREGSWQTTGPCDAGYICYGGAATSTPTDGVTGEICPAGGYCPPRKSHLARHSLPWRPGKAMSGAAALGPGKERTRSLFFFGAAFPRFHLRISFPALSTLDLPSLCLTLTHIFLPLTLQRRRCLSPAHRARSTM
jgi:hypothetical protein